MDITLGLTEGIQPDLGQRLLKCWCEKAENWDAIRAKCRVHKDDISFIDNRLAVYCVRDLYGRDDAQPKDEFVKRPEQQYFVVVVPKMGAFLVDTEGRNYAHYAVYLGDRANKT